MPNNSENTPRADAGKPRIEGAQNAERILLYIPGYGIGPKISKALRDDLKRAKKLNPKATVSTVLIDWIAVHLGYKED